jgi:hypothetical protein
MSQPEIPRDQWGKPLILQADGKTRAYARASSLGKVLEDETTLTRWKMRTTLIGATLAPDVVLSASAHRQDKAKLDRLVEDCMSAARSHARAEIGTALHKLLETIDQGIDPGPFPEQYAADVEAYKQATTGWTYAGMERFVVCDDLKAAGSFDRLRRMPDGRLRVVDLKTGSSIDYSTLSIAVQLAVYANGEEYDPRDGTRSSLGDVDRDWAIVVHLPAGEGRCTVYDVDINNGLYAAHLAMKVKGMRYPSRKWFKVAAPDLEALIAEAPSPDHLADLWSTRAPEFTAELQALAAARHALLTQGVA